MKPAYDEESTGCGLLVLAYILGSYLFVLPSLATGEWSWPIVLAPIALPILCPLGWMLLNNSEVGTTLPFMLAATFGWFASIGGTWGMLTWRRCRLNAPRVVGVVLLLAAAGAWVFLLVGGPL
ncbi:MAG: hypothetical protein NTW19_06535 [Planctomycetota bacterium]|nr:hypothetical protein [Planctomycetota bacterium]